MVSWLQHLKSQFWSEHSELKTIRFIKILIRCIPIPTFVACVNKGTLLLFRPLAAHDLPGFFSAMQDACFFFVENPDNWWMNRMIWGKSPHFSMDKYAKKNHECVAKTMPCLSPLGNGDDWGMVHGMAPTFSQSISMGQSQKVKKSNCSSPSHKTTTRLTCHFVFRKCGTGIFEENECPWCFCTRGVFCSRTTCAWSAMVICTARVSASPMRRSAWSLARSVWCYQSLGDDKGDAGRESLTYATRWCPIVS